MADAAGDVRAPDTDLTDQMPQLILAQRGYEANLATLARARETYQSLMGA